jgi:hypothetical protein
LSKEHDKGRTPSSDILERYGRRGGSARKTTKSGGLWRRITDSVSPQVDSAAPADEPQGRPADEAPAPSPPAGDRPTPVPSSSPTRKIRLSPNHGIGRVQPSQSDEAALAEPRADRGDPTDPDPTTPKVEPVALELILPDGQRLVLVGRAPVAQPSGLVSVQIDPPPTNPAAVVSALNQLIAAQTAETESPPLSPTATEPSPSPPNEALPARPASLTWGRSHERGSPPAAVREGRGELRQSRSPRVQRGGAAAAGGQPPAENARTDERNPFRPDDASDSSDR